MPRKEITEEGQDLDRDGSILGLWSGDGEVPAQPRLEGLPSKPQGRRVIVSRMRHQQVLVSAMKPFAKCPPPWGATGTPPARGIAYAIDFIEANIDQDLDLPSLAKVSAMSVYHFARCFKRVVGVSPHAYVVRRRIHRAKYLLQCATNRLVDVSIACGFSSQAHFTTAFRRDSGVTPGEYRRAQALLIADLQGPDRRQAMPVRALEGNWGPQIRNQPPAPAHRSNLRSSR